jgi:hypothetical protein
VTDLHTKVGIKQNTETRACEPEGGEKAPHFGQWKLEDPWQIEDDPLSIKEATIEKKRCH